MTTILCVNFKDNITHQFSRKISLKIVAISLIVINK